MFLSGAALGFGLGVTATLFTQDWQLHRDLAALREKLEELKPIIPYLRGLDEQDSFHETRKDLP